MKKTVLILAGTRPEMIKVAPVVRLFKADARFNVQLVHTGQHDTLADQVLSDFGIKADHRLILSRSTGGLSELTALLLTEIESLYQKIKPDIVFAQGDTTTVFCAGLTCFYQKIPFGHIEAGLRSDSIFSPFPEEFNRRAVGLFSELNFCPTERAKQNLIEGGTKESQICITGNTVIDALKYISQHTPEKSSLIKEGAFNILFTSHRRENFGEKQNNIFLAIKEICEKFPQVNVIFPVHPNPEVKKNVSHIFGKLSQMRLIDPLDYKTLVQVLKDCQLTVTDSGGIQEEAPFLGVPVVVIRDETERQEVIEHGLGVLTGTSKERIISEVSKMISEPVYRQKFIKHWTPYGDGNASQKILDATLKYFCLG